MQSSPLMNNDSLRCHRRSAASTNVTHAGSFRRRLPLIGSLTAAALPLSLSRCRSLAECCLWQDDVTVTRWRDFPGCCGAVYAAGYSAWLLVVAALAANNLLPICSGGRCIRFRKVLTCERWKRRKDPVPANFTHSGGTPATGNASGGGGLGKLFYPVDGRCGEVSFRSSPTSWRKPPLKNLLISSRRIKSEAPTRRAKPAIEYWRAAGDGLLPQLIVRTKRNAIAMGTLNENGHANVSAAGAGNACMPPHADDNNTPYFYN